jgi:predicted dehydrogenase
MQDAGYPATFLGAFINPKQSLSHSASLPKRNNMASNRLNRREFIRRAAVGAAGAYVLPRFAIGKEGLSPNSKINVAAIGCQGMGGNDLWDIAQQPQSHIIGLCDVDAKKLANPCYKPPGKDGAPGREVLKAPDAKRYSDFREMLHDLGDKVDAVVVGTPDHTHFPASMLAMSLGKHVYCEKPLTNEIWCTRQMLNLANKAGVVTQMGIQSHANDGLRLAREWYEAGAIGQAREIVIWTDRPLWASGRGSYPPTNPVRENFNWDLWLSYQKFRPYGAGYEPFTFRTWWDFGAGALGDIACHSMDLAYFVFDLNVPTRVEVLRSDNCTEISPPSASTIRYHFPAGKNHGPLALTWYDGHYLADEARNLPESGKIPIWSNSAGKLRVQNMPKPPPGWPENKPLVGNGQFIIGDKGYIYNPSMHITTPEVYPRTRWEEFWQKLPPRTLPRNKGGHHHEWLEAVVRRDPKMAMASFQYSAPLTENVLLGKLALRSGKDVVWDSQNLRVSNNDEANKYVKPYIREGWLFGV